MILSFRNKETEDIFDDTNSKRARKLFPQTLWSIAQRKLDLLNAATELSDLRVPPGNNLEALERDRKGQHRKGQHSIRINDQFRICFKWTSRGVEDVQIADYH
jgi:proteic killer suppression protein